MLASGIRLDPALRVERLFGASDMPFVQICEIAWG